MLKVKPEIEKLKIVKVVVLVLLLIGAGFIIFRSKKPTEEIWGATINLKCSQEGCDYSEKLSKDDFLAKRAPDDLELIKSSDPERYATYEGFVNKTSRRGVVPTPEQVERNLRRGLGGSGLQHMPMLCPKCEEYSMYKVFKEATPK